MEKFGLFDLIDKFSEAANGKNSAKNGGKQAGSSVRSELSVLRDPDVAADPQYLMNAKLAAFVSRHDELAEKIAEKNSGQRQK